MVRKNPLIPAMAIMSATWEEIAIIVPETGFAAHNEPIGTRGFSARKSTITNATSKIRASRRKGKTWIDVKPVS